MKIGLHGASGRMGKEVAALISEYNSCELAYEYSRGGNLEDLCVSSEVIIDFSSPEALPDLLLCAIKYAVPILIGTTGILEDMQKSIVTAAKEIPILQSPNTSFGVNVLQNLITKAAETLINYDIEIIEMHHATKKDAPSGTALMLGDVAATSSGQALDSIGFSSVRAGALFGEHQVMFVGQNEVVTLAHRALSRRCYAEGAIRAAMWLREMSPSLYNMQDMLHGAARKN